MNNKITIAIDGYSSSGKSTMAKRLAAEIGYRYIDSGAMYRAVTLFAMQHNMISQSGTPDKDKIIAALPDIKINFQIQDGTQSTILNGVNVEKEIRQMAVSNNVSPVAAIPEVRHCLVAMQQAFGKEKGIVMDGRDIATVVFPDAELKLFLTARPEVRAQRRYDELIAKGEHPDYNDVLRDVNDRDYRDTHRAESPLRQAEDAIVIDNSDMTREQQMEHIYSLFDKATI